MSEGTYLEEPHANRDNAQSAPAVRLYRFYNLQESAYGTPFALCDRHRASQQVPQFCHLERIADKAAWPCNKCNEEPQEPEPE